MKIDLTRVLRLRPFDESIDPPNAGLIYASSAVLTILVLSTIGAALGGLMLAIGGNSNSVRVLSLAVALSAITSGFEWMNGLKGRAKNQLFLCVVMCAVLISI